MDDDPGDSMHQDADDEAGSSPQPDGDGRHLPVVWYNRLQIAERSKADILETDRQRKAEAEERVQEARRRLDAANLMLGVTRQVHRKGPDGT